MHICRIVKRPHFNNVYKQVNVRPAGEIYTFETNDAIGGNLQTCINVLSLN